MCGYQIKVIHVGNDILCECLYKGKNYPDSKVHGANMGPTWVLLAPDGPHVGPINLAVRELIGGWSDSGFVNVVWNDLVTLGYGEPLSHV